MYSLIDEANKSSSWAQFFRVQLATEEVSRNIISDISTDIREDNIVDEFGKGGPSWIQMNGSTPITYGKDWP